LILTIFIAASLLVAALTIITIFFKISVHAAGAGCMIGFLLSIMLIFPEHNLMWALVVIVLVGGLIMSARLYLNAHTPVEVYSGFALGLFISFFSLYFLV
jgi:membrane-associated phospholipid phosphatase